MLRLDRLAEEFVHRAAEIEHLLGARRHRIEVAGEILVGRADQREILRERQREHDALVGVLEDVAAVVVEQLAHHDVAALGEPHRRRPAMRSTVSATMPTQGPAALTSTRAVTTSRRPCALRISRQIILALGAGDARAGADRGAALGGVERVEHDQPGIVHPAVGIFEAGAEFPHQRLAGDVVGEIERARRRQDFARAEPVVEEQPEPQHERRARPRHRRQHEAHRPDDVRRHPQQHLALGQRLAHQPERAVLEIAQAAVDELGRGRRGARAEVVLLQQQHAQAAAGGVARDAGAVDAAADDGEIVVGHISATMGTG